MNAYKSPYEAYPFLSDNAANLNCDFELLTDLIASETGLLAAKMQTPKLKIELLKVCELVYHANAALRTKNFTVTEAEIAFVLAQTEQMQKDFHTARFVLTAGCESACHAHILRVRAKMLVRLIYRHIENGGCADSRLIDFCNILSGYFFALALRLNAENNITETEFISRNY